VTDMYTTVTPIAYPQSGFRLNITCRLETARQSKQLMRSKARVQSPITGGCDVWSGAEKGDQKRQSGQPLSRHSLRLHGNETPKYPQVEPAIAEGKGRRVRIVRLQVSGFRGIQNATFHFAEHTVLIGANSSGKSTVVDALALALGREVMVRDVTEHDFFGSDPEPAARFRIVVTLVGFDPNDATAHDQWFREGRGVPKWWSESKRSTAPEPTTDHTQLCVEIGYAARFDHETLTVERLRYFHDDDDIADPFIEDAVCLFPKRLLGEVGFFVVPASRARERILSFASEIFRRVVASQDALPADELLAERNRLRRPIAPVEQSPALSGLVGRINDELARLLPQQPKFQMRITATDSESVLQALVPHFEYLSATSLPAHRHGMGLLSLQTMILLLEFGRLRREGGGEFVLAIEEPELHLPPGLQRRVVHRARTASHQTIVTTHSSRIAAFYQPNEIRVVENDGGTVRGEPLHAMPLNAASPNWQRRLLLDDRQHLTEALMHDIVLVPEGRSDFECIRLLVDVLELGDTVPASDRASAIQFGTRIGVVPTHDASVVGTFQLLAAVRGGVAVLVDGDAAGNDYVSALLSLPNPPTAILQWAQDDAIEEMLIWLLEPLPSEQVAALSSVLPQPVASLKDLLGLLKTKRSSSSPNGLKADYLAYEEIVRFIRNSDLCASRATTLLAAIHDALTSGKSERFEVDSRSTETTKVLEWAS
jgi:putative ATP-dependent endonuclease of the OLD family